MNSEAAPDERMSVTIAGRHIEIPKTEVNSVVRSKADDFLDLVRKELERFSVTDEARSGVVLSGGGALLDGMTERAGEFLNLPVRIGALKTSGLTKGKPSHLFAPSIGALKDYAGEIRARSVRPWPKNRLSRFTHRITTFLNEYF